MDKERRIQHILNKMIKKINAEYEYIFNLHYDSDYENDYLRGKEECIIEILGVVQSTYDYLFGDDKNERN